LNIMAAKVTPKYNSTRELARLVDARPPMSIAEREEQRRNAVHGNVGLEYPGLTRAQVDAALNKR
jgi:hypothetical protein